MNWKDLRQRGEYVAFRLIAGVFQILTWRQTVAVAEFLAWVFHRVLPRKLTRYHVARENIIRAFPEYDDQQIDRVIHGMWVHLFRMIAEIIQLPRKVRLYNCADVLTFRHRDETVKTLCTGRPVMVLSGHYGNWEMAISTFGMFGFPMGVVARDLDNPYLHRWFQKFREKTGHRLISKSGASTDLVNFLDQRAHVGLLGDQDAGKRGLFVDFFGHPASTFKSIALLAIQYRAILLVGYARRLPDDFQNRRWTHFELGTEAILDPLDYDGPNAVRELTADYTAAFERMIRLSPEQYFWVHRRWKSAPRVRKSKAEKQSSPEQVPEAA